jgi:hypothetical protein
MLKRKPQNPPSVVETPFARFFRSATPEEKAEVYARVMQRATQRQLDIINSASKAPLPAQR